MKRIITLILCVGLSCVIVLVLPNFISGNSVNEVNYTNEKTIIPQKVLKTLNIENEYYKLYKDGQLMAVISDRNSIDEAISEEYKKYEEKFPNTTLGLKDDLYLVKEKSYNVFENVDDKVVAYLKEHDCFGISANCIEFSVPEGVYERIYVQNIDDFYTARDQFLLNFISEDAYKALASNTKIEEISSFGSADVNLKIEESITYTKEIVSPNDIYTSIDEIYEFLCFGRNTTRQYYEVQEGDTLNGVGFRFGDLSPLQLVSLNKDVLKSTDQVLTVGMLLNVTYFSSPINVVVTKHRLVQETIAPPTPDYIEDTKMAPGKLEVEVEEVIGLKNVLYEEVWKNGVLQEGNEISSTVVREASKGVIRVGVGAQYRVGTGNFRWPTDNAHISCGWHCYFMNGAYHNGTDITNRYSRYGPIYAADSGTVERVGYDDLSGNFVRINHNNGYKTYYGHMNTVPYVTEGEGVSRGQLIGQIGMTGYATGPHIHFMIYVDNEIVDVCTIMDCSEIGG